MPKEAEMSCALAVVELANNRMGDEICSFCDIVIIHQFCICHATIACSLLSPAKDVLAEIVPGTDNVSVVGQPHFAKLSEPHMWTIFS